MLASWSARVASVHERISRSEKRTMAAATRRSPFANVAIDQTGDAGLAFGISGVPETFMVDAKGRIVKSFRGPLDAARGKEFLDAYRAEVAKGAG